MGVTTVGQRIVFENAKTTLKNNGIEPNTAILTQSYLRLEQPVTTTATNIVFPILVNQTFGSSNTTFITERRLQLQDSFVVSDLALFLFFPSAVGATTSHLYSYPSFFITAASYAQYQQIYHGYLTLSVNNQVIVPFWDVQRSYKVNQTQNLAAIAAASPDDQLDWVACPVLAKQGPVNLIHVFSPGG